MTKHCRHEFITSADYPEDRICSKCQTIWRLPDYISWSAKQLMTLPKVIHYEVVKRQVEMFTKDNPNYYMPSERKLLEHESESASTKE